MKNIFLILIFSFGATLLFGQKEEARIVNGSPAPFHWFDHLGPNLGVAAFLPYEDKGLGAFIGPEFGLNLYMRNRVHARTGPAYFRVYAQAALLRSQLQDTTSILSSSLGVEFSFEDRIKRAVFVPFWGLEYGGIQRSDFEKARSRAAFILGLNLLHTQQVIWRVRGAYSYGFGANFEEFSGIYMQTTLSFRFW